jgi:hypothetical protein
LWAIEIPPYEPPSMTVSFWVMFEKLHGQQKVDVKAIIREDDIKERDLEENIADVMMDITAEPDVYRNSFRVVLWSRTFVAAE